MGWKRKNRPSSESEYRTGQTEDRKKMKIANKKRLLSKFGAGWGGGGGGGSGVDGRWVGGWAVEGLV